MQRDNASHETFERFQTSQSKNREERAARFSLRPLGAGVTPAARRGGDLILGSGPRRDLGAQVVLDFWRLAFRIDTWRRWRLAMPCGQISPNRNLTAQA
jgi:hypothetical protein